MQQENMYNVLKSHDNQKWLMKRYQITANAKYLRQPHNQQEEKHLNQLFEFLIENSPQIGKQNCSNPKIDMDNFYQLLKKQGKHNFMDRERFEKIIKLLDKERNRQLNKSDFCSLIMSSSIGKQLKDLNKQSFKSYHSQPTDQIPLSQNLQYPILNDKMDLDSLQQNNQSTQTIQETPERKVCNDKISQDNFQFHLKKVNQTLNTVRLKAKIRSRLKTKEKISQQTKQHSHSQESQKQKETTTCQQDDLRSCSLLDSKSGNKSTLFTSNSKEREKQFSHIDISRLIGNMKFDKERKQLQKQFSLIRNDASIQINQKCNQLSQILMQKHLNIEYLGISSLKKIKSVPQSNTIKSPSFPFSQQFSINQTEALSQSRIQFPDKMQTEPSLKCMNYKTNNQINCKTIQDNYSRLQFERIDLKTGSSCQNNQRRGRQQLIHERQLEQIFCQSENPIQIRTLMNKANTQETLFSRDYRTSSLANYTQSKQYNFNVQANNKQYQIKCFTERKQLPSQQSRMKQLQINQTCNLPQSVGTNNQMIKNINQVKSQIGKYSNPNKLQYSLHQTNSFNTMDKTDSLFSNHLNSTQFSYTPMPTGLDLMDSGYINLKQNQILRSRSFRQN